MEPMFSKEQLYGKMGHMKTRSLFIETCGHGDEPFLSLRPTKDNPYISLRDLYISMCTDDPSETTFAETCFGDLKFWNHLKSSDWMKEHLEEWEKVSSTRRKAKAFKVLINEVETNGKGALTAAKYLIEEPWKLKESTDKRQTRQKIRESAEEAFTSKGISEDFKRLKEEGYIQ